MHLKLNQHDRICFLGDSITADGRWIAEINEYFLKNLPELKIHIFNCGIAGSQGCQANLKDRLYCDCFNHFPKYTVIMFGMNDILPWLYNPDCTESDKEERRNKALSQYGDTLENIIEMCKKNNSIPIICSPTPYDQYTESEHEKWYANPPLFTCREVAEKTAKKHGLIFVDMHTSLMSRMDKCPIGEDRIHPNDFGHHLMSETFLTASGMKDNFDENGLVEISPKNKARYDVEIIIRRIMYIERDGMLWQFEPDKTLDERKRLVKEKMHESPFFEATANLYLENIDYLDVLRGDLLKKTMEMYD